MSRSSSVSDKEVHEQVEQVIHEIEEAGNVIQHKTQETQIFEVLLDNMNSRESDKNIRAIKDQIKMIKLVMGITKGLKGHS